MICNAAGTVAFAIGVSGHRSKVGMERGADGGIKDRSSVLRAENDVDQKK